MYRLLIVEDDAGIAGEIKKQSELWGLKVRIAENYRDILQEFSDFDPHLILLDIKLPFYNGYHWCEQIRRVSQVPIIFISSAGDDLNIIMAVNMGGDDFIVKPFDMNVLTAKLQALLRRTYDFSMFSPILEHKNAQLNTAEQTITYNGNRIELSKNEYRILLTLMENKGKVVSREKLMEALWQTDSFVDENTLTVNVGRLRKKLDNAGLTAFITTKHGIGYIIRVER